jgi:cyclic pyranopterin phosphate synthase
MRPWMPRRCATKIPGLGHFGVIANESVPFCRTCSRLRLSSTGWLHGCLSSSNRHYVGDLLDKPRHQALPALQRLLVKALGDKQEVAFSGGATVMKIIGG